MLIADAYLKTWPMCVFSLAFFVAVAALAWRLRLPRLDAELPARAVFWSCLAAWFVLMCIIETLIDKPHVAISEVMKDWLFMFSAFLFLPVTMPLLAGAVWALMHALRRETVRVSGLALVMLGAFGLGCAASNVHDVVWCGFITNGYAQHFKAGFDLDLFVAFARWFGITEAIAADYATLGPYAAILVLGELVVAAACYVRLRQIGLFNQDGDHAA